MHRMCGHFFRHLHQRFLLRRAPTLRRDTAFTRVCGDNARAGRTVRRVAATAASVAVRCVCRCATTDCNHTHHNRAFARLPVALRHTHAHYASTAPPLSFLSWAVDGSQRTSSHKPCHRRLDLQQRITYIRQTIHTCAPDVVALQDSTPEVAAAVCDRWAGAFRSLTHTQPAEKNDLPCKGSPVEQQTSYPLSPSSRVLAFNLAGYTGVSPALPLHRSDIATTSTAVDAAAAADSEMNQAKASTEEATPAMICQEDGKDDMRYGVHSKSPVTAPMYRLVGSARNGRYGEVQLLIRNTSPWQARLLPAEPGVTVELFYEDTQSNHSDDTRRLSCGENGETDEQMHGMSNTRNNNKEYQFNSSSAVTASALACALQVTPASTLPPVTTTLPSRKAIRCIVSVVDLTYRGKSLALKSALLPVSPVRAERERSEAGQNAHTYNNSNNSRAVSTASAATSFRLASSQADCATTGGVKGQLDLHRAVVLDHLRHITRADVIVGNLFMAADQSVSGYNDVWARAGAPRRHEQTTHIFCPYRAHSLRSLLQQNKQQGDRQQQRHDDSHSGDTVQKSHENDLPAEMLDALSKRSNYFYYVPTQRRTGEPAFGSSSTGLSMAAQVQGGRSRNTDPCETMCSTMLSRMPPSLRTVSSTRNIAVKITPPIGTRLPLSARCVASAQPYQKDSCGTWYVPAYSLACDNLSSSHTDNKDTNICSMPRAVILPSLSCSNDETESPSRPTVSLHESSCANRTTLLDHKEGGVPTNEQVCPANENDDKAKLCGGGDVCDTSAATCTDVPLGTSATNARPVEGLKDVQSPAEGAGAEAEEAKDVEEEDVVGPREVAGRYQRCYTRRAGSASRTHNAHYVFAHRFARQRVLVLHPFVQLRLSPEEAAWHAARAHAWQKRRLAKTSETSARRQERKADVSERGEACAPLQDGARDGSLCNGDTCEARGGEDYTVWCSLSDQYPLLTLFS